MPQKYTLSSSRRNTISNDGIMREYFDTFSPKSGLEPTFINNYNQGFSINFPCCSFTGKEKDPETGYGYFGARYMDHELMTMWLSVDPMSDKYPGISPYAYCAWNPVKLIDPDGRDVLPCSDKAYEMILRSIPIEARAYVKRNSDGYIDRDLINSYSCESQNFNDLKELVNMDDCTIEVMLANNYEWVDKDGNIQNWDMPYSNPELDAEFLKSLSGPIPDVGQFESPYKLSTGEYGDVGVALRPTSNSGKRSTNGNIQVYINEKLSVMGQVENFAHEFFGHAYLYAKTRSTTLSEHDYDTEPGTDSNTLLKNRIKRAQNEAASYNR
jgi:RHS repeat-associated protein